MLKRRSGQLPDLLERQRRAAGRARQDQPVLPMRVRLAGPGRLIARAVPQAEQLPVELGQAPRVGGVQDRLPDDRERLLIVHTATLGTGAVNPAGVFKQCLVWEKSQGLVSEAGAERIARPW